MRGTRPIVFGSKKFGRLTRSKRTLEKRICRQMQTETPDLAYQDEVLVLLLDRRSVHPRPAYKKILSSRRAIEGLGDALGRD